MIISMTGFGRVEVCEELISLNIEIRSVNNRFFDLDIKLPKQLSHLRDEAYNLIKTKCLRGKVSLTTEFKTGDGKSSLKYILDNETEIITVAKMLNLFMFLNWKMLVI